jgi:nucleotide-binding universal stress UspA family protein
MTSGRPPASGNILVGVDGSPSSEHAVIWAADEARVQHRGITLVHAQTTLSANQLAMFSTAGIHPHEVNEQIRRGAEKIIERASALAEDRYPGGSVQTVIAPQDARSLLLDLESTAAMTVVGTRGHGRVASLLLGSVSAALVRHAERPVVVVRPQAAPGRGVLVAADGSEESIELVEHGFGEASMHRCPLTVVHCLWDGLAAQARWAPVADTDPEAEEARLSMAETIAGMREKFPDVDLAVKVTRGAIDACLVELSAQHELLVIGRPPRPLLVRLTVSGLTLPVVEHARCPVLVVP